jgi:hypothetical protein
MERETRQQRRARERAEAKQSIETLADRQQEPPICPRCGAPQAHWRHPLNEPDTPIAEDAYADCQTCGGPAGRWEQDAKDPSIRRLWDVHGTLVLTTMTKRL